jgi:hypothetical protein
VAGVRGAPDVWAFRCEGADSAGAALRFVRESRGLYDSRVEVWLDAARGFLPIRLSMTNGVEAQAFELALEAVGPESRSGPAGAAPEPALAFRPDGPK